MYLMKMHYVSSGLNVDNLKTQMKLNHDKTKQKQQQKEVEWFLLKKDQRWTLQQSVPFLCTGGGLSRLNHFAACERTATQFL